MTTSSDRRTAAVITSIVASIAVVQLLFWILPSVFEPWNARTVDQFFLLRSAIKSLRPAYDSTIVHIDLSDRSSTELENSYLNRFQYAQVVRNLAEMGTSLQSWDFIFPAKMNQAQDSAFVACVAKAGNAYFGLSLNVADKPRRRQRTGRVPPLSAYLAATTWNIRVDGSGNELPVAQQAKTTYHSLAAASRGLGFLNVDSDLDGVYRRAHILFRYGEGYYPNLAFRVACDYLGVSADRVHLNPGKSVTLKDARQPGRLPHDIIIPIDQSGAMLVNYVGPLNTTDSTSSMLHYDFVDILRASDDRTELDLWKDVLTGKIAVVSEVATGASDFGPVPTDNQFPLSGVHSNILNTILTENFLRGASWIEMLAVEFSLLLAVALLALNLSGRGFSISSFVLIVGYLIFALAAFLYAKVIIDVVRPIAEVAFASFAIVAYRYVTEQKAREVLRRSFETFFPPSVARRLMLNPSLVTAGGHKKVLTIMFTDIKSFTTYSEALSPDEIRKLLNEYYEAMVEILFKYEGTLDKFIGDGLMVFFGDPEPQTDHALRCVRAAIEMQEKCRDLKGRWEREKQFPLMVRIGINTGPVIVGNMGSARRLSYTALGVDVNLAQRLEASAPAEGILISESTYEHVKDLIKTLPPKLIHVKGFDKPINVYEIQLAEYLAGSRTSALP